MSNVRQQRIFLKIQWTFDVNGIGHITKVYFSLVILLVTICFPCLFCDAVAVPPKKPTFWSKCPILLIQRPSLVNLKGQLEEQPLRNPAEPKWPPSILNRLIKSDQGSSSTNNKGQLYLISRGNYLLKLLL